MGDVGRSLLRGNMALVDQCVDFYAQHFLIAISLSSFAPAARMKSLICMRR